MRYSLPARPLTSPICADNGYATEDSYVLVPAGSGHSYCYVQFDASQIVEGKIATADAGQVEFWEVGNFNMPAGGGSIPMFMRH
jgi:hypothetical protein